MRTCPPSTEWYSSDRAQLRSSGYQRGTETAMVPPGRSTRTSSAMAARSAGMCSSTSAAITRSKVSSENGSANALATVAPPAPPRANHPVALQGLERGGRLFDLDVVGVQGDDTSPPPGG